MTWFPLFIGMSWHFWNIFKSVRLHTIHDIDISKNTWVMTNISVLCFSFSFRRWFKRILLILSQIIMLRKPPSMEGAKGILGICLLSSLAFAQGRPKQLQINHLKHSYNKVFNTGVYYWSFINSTFCRLWSGLRAPRICRL